MNSVSIWKKSICSILTGLLVCSMSGCLLLPKEEETRKVSYVKQDEPLEYTFISPERRNIDKYVDIPCSYRQMQEKSLRFTEDKQIVESVYYSIGDKVKKGNLLASLQTGNLEEEIKSLNDSIEQMEGEIEQIKQKASYDKKYVELEYKHEHITKAERNQRIAAIEDGLKDEITIKNDAKRVQVLRVQQKKKKLDDSRIYAPIDGIISFVQPQLLNSSSNINVDVIKMIDPKKCAFEIYTTDDTSYLKEGETYTVDCEGASFEGTLMPFKEKKPAIIYLQLKEASMNVELGQIGIIHYHVGGKKNVLTLPTDVVHKGKDFNFVYVLDKVKGKAIQKVELGFKTADYTEIISGLKDDDEVIKE